MSEEKSKNLYKTLHDIGLSESEAKTYLTMLSIGSNPVSTIAKVSNLNRCTCYAILERLKKKSFVHEDIKNNLSYYEAVNPKYIVAQLKNKRHELDAHIDNLTNSIAQIELIKKEQQCKPRVVFYEGAGGVQNILEDTLTTKDEIRCYASFTEMINLLPNYFPDYFKRRVQKGISVRGIYPADEIGYGLKKRDAAELRESRLIPEEFDFHLDILIYDNKVALTSLKENFGILIESKEMAEAQKKIFDFIWHGTKQYDELITKTLENKQKVVSESSPIESTK
jgi:sugar-specific transcriptional regulator TrmB